jgi:hypothetical protein
VSLNDNNIQIYTRQGKEWVVTETLSEVCFVFLGPSATATDRQFPSPARQTHHVNRLGPELEPHRNRLPRSQRIRLVSLPRSPHRKVSVEAYLGASPHQQSRYICTLEPQRGQIRSRQWSEVRAPYLRFSSYLIPSNVHQGDRYLFFRSREQLVGSKAAQETDQIDCSFRRLASEQCSTRGGERGYEGTRVLGLH